MKILLASVSLAAGLLTAGAFLLPVPVFVSNPVQLLHQPQSGLEPFRDAIEEAAALTGLPAEVIAAVAHQESHFVENAVSHVGAIGVMQLMPATARELGVDPFDGRASILAGARHLKSLLDRYDGNLGLALAAYNWGQGNVGRWLKGKRRIAGVPQETQDYVAAITGTPLRTWLAKPVTLDDLVRRTVAIGGHVATLKARL
jgi:soluble lytic murein transglycosylase-like protein